MHPRNILAVLVAFTTTAFASENSKSYIVSYKNETPQHVVDDAINQLRKAGAVIEHQYTFIKAFAVKASDDVINAIHALNAEWPATIEEDQMVTAQGE